MDSEGSGSIQSQLFSHQLLAEIDSDLATDLQRSWRLLVFVNYLAGQGAILDTLYFVQIDKDEVGRGQNARDAMGNVRQPWSVDRVDAGQGYLASQHLKAVEGLL